MKVDLVAYTPDALTVLLASKQTRLDLTPGLMDEVRAWPESRKMAELEYMRGTIQSSWEFVDYTFILSGVTRAFTHQFVRTRAGSYAQQSQRTVNMQEGFQYLRTGRVGEGEGNSWPSDPFADPDPTTRPEIPTAQWIYDDAMESIGNHYANLIAAGVPPQDARGVLPTNILTNIMAKFSLRTLADMAKIRLCTRTQGEYQHVFRAMRDEVLKVHPWAEPFIRVACAATGVCAFPNYTECPIKGGVFNPDTGARWDRKSLPIMTREEIQREWELVDFEAVPHAAKR